MIKKWNFCIAAWNDDDTKPTYSPYVFKTEPFFEREVEMSKMNFQNVVIFTKYGNIMAAWRNGRRAG